MRHRKCKGCGATALRLFAGALCPVCEAKRIEQFAPLWAPSKSSSWIPEPATNGPDPRGTGQ